MEVIYFLLLAMLCVTIAVIFWAIVGLSWCKWRNFFHRYYSFFDALFIFGYFIEELILTLLIFLYHENAPLWAGIFAIIIITTAAFQKLTWERRLDRISQASIEQKNFLDIIFEKNSSLIEENKKLKKSAEKMKDFIEELMIYLKKSLKQKR